MPTSISITQAIQSILAPAVMISSTWLFVLSLNTRQSAVFTRIRVLNEEKRKLLYLFEKEEKHEIVEEQRYLNIDYQMNLLVKRIWYIRNAIISQTIAVVFFVLTSFAIGIDSSLSHNSITYGIPLLLFIVGMLLVLIGSLSLAFDEWLSYSVILIEVRDKLGNKN